MPTGNQFAWQSLVAHFGADSVNGISSSRRQFASHLLPDLQMAIMAESAPFDPVLSDPVS